MTLPIGPRPVAAAQQGLQVPGPDASNEALSSFAQAVAKLSSPERSLCLRTVFIHAARNSHFEIIKIIFKGREWLWAKEKFSVMACIVEHYDPGNLAHRRAFMDLFGRVAGERRTVRLLSSEAECRAYEAQVKDVLTSVREKDPELANWCEGQWRMSEMTYAAQRELI
jgi:hypothetical protein